MAIIKQDYGSIGGGSNNPTLVPLPTSLIQPGYTGTVTIDPSKDYLFIGSYKYSDTQFRQEIQSIVKGVVTTLTNNWGATYLKPCTVSGTTLTIITTTGSNTYIDLSLVQLN